MTENSNSGLGWNAKGPRTGPFLYHLGGVMLLSNRGNVLLSRIIEFLNANVEKGANVEGDK